MPPLHGDTQTTLRHLQGPYGPAATKPQSRKHPELPECHTQKVPCTTVPGDVESAIPGLLDDLPSQVGGPALRLLN